MGRLRFVIPIIFLIFIITCYGSGKEEEKEEMTTDFSELREKMVERQLINRGIDDELVLDAMREVPREEFVLNSDREYAYSDGPLAIGYGQTISQPYIVALMTQLLELEESDRVLEIGTGSGYQAAVLAEIVDEVYTIEIIEELSERAQEILKELDYDNIHYKVGDGFIGWEENAPFDGIIVTCAPDEIPQPLIDQLADDGRMVIPVGEYLPQDLEVVEKKDGEVSIKSITSVSFVPMTGISEEE
jgi:protein-L-isoaspartate(D-aspartate) O-methyltransferase